MKYIFLSYLFISTLLSVELLSLKDQADTFILEEKQIHIPGYKDAFNPSIVRVPDGRLLLSFRARDKITGSPHLIGFTWISENFEVMGEPKLLTIYGDRPLKVSRAQDPRLVLVGDTVYVVYNNIICDEDLDKRRMVVAPLHYNEDEFFVINPQYLLTFEGELKNNWREKSWSPFDYKGVLLLSYSIAPHKVFLPLLYNDVCETISNSFQKIDWNFGELRGGTPSLIDGEEYLSFFHSSKEMVSLESKGKKISHYFIGAYRFHKEPPFTVTHISKRPIIGKEFYTAPNYPTWKPLRAVFPAGFLMNENLIYIFYGRQDHEIWVVKIDKNELMNSLIEVK